MYTVAGNFRLWKFAILRTMVMADWKSAMEFRLQGNSIKSEGDLHQALDEIFDFGPYYGRNLAALWDRLTTDVPRPVHLIWADSALSRAKMGEDTFIGIVKVFQDVEQQDRDLERTERFVFVCE